MMDISIGPTELMLQSLQRIAFEFNFFYLIIRVFHTSSDAILKECTLADIVL